MDATYSGVCNRSECNYEVFKNGRELPLAPSLALRNHSPTGFAWGYGGSGPAQLALALLLDATGDAEAALLHYHDFKWQVVSLLGDTWQMGADFIVRWMKSLPQPIHAEGGE